MYFGTKSYLKSNHYHTPKHPLRVRRQSHFISKSLSISDFGGPYEYYIDHNGKLIPLRHIQVQ